jgi:hypothetical protein
VEAAVRLEGATCRILKIRGRVAHRRMIVSQDFEDRRTGLRAGIVGLQHASLIPIRQVAHCGPDAAAEDFRVEGPCLRLIVLDRVRAVPALHLRLSVIDEGSELALIPEVHPVLEPAPDVPGSLDPWRRPQDDGHIHQGSLGVPSARTDAAELTRELGQKATAHFSFQQGIVGCWQDDNPSPSSLPGRIALHASVQVTAVIRMRLVSVDGVEELVGRPRIEARPVGPRFFAQNQALLGNLMTSRVVIRKVWKEGVPYVLRLGSRLGCRLGRRGIVVVGVVVVIALGGRCCRRHCRLRFQGHHCRREGGGVTPSQIGRGCLQ